MIVLDTDIVTLLSYGRNQKLRQRIEAVEEAEELAVTLITRMEVLQGRFASLVKAANDKELLRAMERFRASEALLGSLRLLEVNDAAARHFKEMTGRKKRLKMKRGDMLNARIALAYEALLVTRNVEDYRPVAGLRVENWAD
jgi:predicted nucleic acid-binding protein